MRDPEDEYYEAQCGCSLTICGECGKCKNCCDCHCCPECDDGSNAYKADSDQWCNDCDRCADHCVCEGYEEDDEHTKCRKCERVVENQDICGAKRHVNICIRCAGCSGMSCSKCPLDKQEEGRTGDETGVTIYYKSDNDEPPK